MTLDTLTTLCDAMVKLMHPLMEIVVHNRQTGRIAYLSGKRSPRQVGDESLLDDVQPAHLNTLTYSKLNFDGRLVKSISIPIEDTWLVCLNADISVFNTLQQLSAQFLGPVDAQPDSLFKHDWQERLHQTLHHYLHQQGWSFPLLTMAQKKTVLAHLYQQGVFQQRHATNYVAQILGISRATVFNTIKSWRTP